MARKTRRTARAVVLGRSRASGQARGEALLGELTSADPLTRCMAALGLGRHAGREALEALEAAALGDDLELAACARTGLALLEVRLGDLEAAAELADKESLRIGADTSPAKAVAAEMTQAVARADLVRAGLTSPYAAERISSIRAMARVGAAVALSVLVPLIEVETDRRVLCVLTVRVGRLDDGSAREAILGLLKHRDEGVRAAAVEALWHARDEEAGHAALPMARDPSEKVRAAAVILLIRRGHQTSRAMAERVMASTRLWMQLTALFALGGMSEPWARQLLIQTIRDTALPPLVRALAREVVALGSVERDREGRGRRRDDAVETVFTDLTRHLDELPDAGSIRAALGHADPLLRVHGLQNARRFGQDEMLPLLLKQVEFETDPLVLATLVKALGRIGGAPHAGVIRGFLEHADERVRANAVEALALASPGPELDNLLKSLMAEDEGPRLRKQAAAQLFASNPVAAVDHFRGLVMTGDAAARGGALSIIAAVQDDRLCEVLREALKDMRREIYEPVVALLVRIGASWPAAGELLAAFRRGEVAGEVVEDRAVGALLTFDMNSSKAADKVRAMGLLALARDPRVATVLELHLGSRDPEVAHVASRVLRDRHRTLTLPGLYQRIGELYGARSRSGELVVPQELAAQLPVGDEVAGEKTDADRLRWLGKSLYDAFEEEIELDSELRALCLDVRAALEQLGSIISPASRPERIAAAAAQARRGDPRSGSRAGEPRPGPAGDASRSGAAWVRPGADGASDGSGNSAGATGAWRRGGSGSGGDWTAGGSGPAWDAAAGGAAGARGRPWGMIAVGVGLLCLGVASFTAEGPPDEVEAAAGATDGSTRMLDAMGLESKPDRFRERFRGRTLNITGRVVSVADSASMDMRAGSVLFRVRVVKGPPLPAGLRLGQSCEVKGSVVEMDADGSITLEASQAVVRET